MPKIRKKPAPYKPAGVNYSCSVQNEVAPFQDNDDGYVRHMPTGRYNITIEVWPARNAEKAISIARRILKHRHEELLYDAK